MKKEKWEIIAHEYVVSLFPVFMLLDAFATKLTQKFIGRKLDFAEKIENNAVWYLINMKQWATAHYFLVSQIKNNPALLRKIFGNIDRQGKKLVAFSQKAAAKNLTALSNNQLIDYYQKYYRQNLETYSYGLTLPVLDYQHTTFLSDEISRFLKSKNAKNYFSLLTTPIQDTFNKLHELNLLKILIQINKKSKILKLFKSLDSNQLVSVLPIKDKKIWQLIKAHTKKYAWVHYVYEGPVANEAYFIDILKDFIKRKIAPQKEIVKHKKEKAILKIKQAEILAKLKPDNYFRQIFILARDAVYFKMYRRDLQTKSYYYFESVLTEIARRLNLTLKQVRMMLFEEVISAIKGSKIKVDEINRRLKLVVYFRRGNTRKVISGNQALAFVKTIKKEKVVTNVKEIKGTTAQPGKVKGVVKLINSPDQMVKMNQGDILISVTTNPNLMPAIRKAAAIVTNEGGLTCHAAIVSREFKIPCVVGTSFVTQVLKDGDIVEVDATKGIVKKL